MPRLTKRGLARVGAVGGVARIWVALAAVPVLAAGTAAQVAGLRTLPQTGAHQLADAQAGSSLTTKVTAESAPVAAAAAASAGGSPSWQVLGRDVIPGLDRARQLGPVSPSQKLQVGIALQDPNRAAEEALARAIDDRSSPSYQHFLTPAQWQARFSLPAATFARVVGQATSKGLSVVYASPTRSYATLAGTAAQVEQTFGVELRQYEQPGGRTFFANVQAPRVPSGVIALMGLENLSVQLPKHPLPGNSTHNAGGPCVQGTCIGTLTAQDLWSIYGMNGISRGQGEKVAVIGEGDMVVPTSDLRKFETTYGLPSVPVKQISVGDDGSDTSGLGEWDIDMQASTGMAPDVQELDLYFGQSLAVTAGPFSAWVNDASGPHQANASFGGCESLNLALGSVQAESPLFTQAAAEGRTLFVSTGDTGGSCTVVTGNGIVNTVVPQVEWPASSRWVVAVGGTEVFASQGASPHRVLEKAWEYTGGGSSITQPAQPWQTTGPGVPIVKSPCLVDETLFPEVTQTCRGLPDVTAMSGDILFNQYLIITSGSTGFGAGTSLASPLWEGMWARVQSAKSGGLGFAAPKLYQQCLDTTADARDFFDISVGDNGQYPAIPRNAADPSGWDFVSGCGAPIVSALMLDLAGQTTTAYPTAPIGGGGTTAATGSCPGPNGTLSAPDGNAAFPFAAASVTKVVPSYSSATNAVTVTFTVPQLSSGTRNELDFYWFFTYPATGHSYQLDATYDPVVPYENVGGLAQAGTAFQLYDLTGSGATAGVLTTFLSNALTGSFNFATGTVTITMPVSVFNSATGLSLAANQTLSNLTASSGYEYLGTVGLSGSQINNGACSFTLM